MRTQSPVGGVTKAGVQEGEQVPHWKLHLRAFKQVRKHWDPRPRQGQSRRLSLTSEPAEERKGTASAVHQSGRRSRCRGPPSCCLKPCRALPGPCCGGFVTAQRRAPRFSGIRRKLPVRDTELWVSITDLACRVFSAQPCDCFSRRPEWL